ncbi:TM2 domain-containing protein [Lysinibacillus sp. ZYM-1]|uniref:TM2 domain-containing protein n=1 Tax=Lysinibacillus sp. ZYM-1 TaxID=1681184 RepID=UPI0018D0617D|nr:TM2 domain-containing protein [Lysinibacillus sp. ZYM-1]
MYDGIDPSWPIKSKGVAGVLAIFLGGLGIHKFYLGKIFQGIVYLIFCWTYIPAIIAFIEGIIYLLSNEHNFSVKHRVRLR